MSFVGKWKRVSSENEEAILKYIGIPEPSIPILMQAEATMDITKDGETYNEIFTQLGQERKNSMTPGEPGKYLTFDGNHVDCDLEFGGTFVKLSYSHNGVKYEGKRELNDQQQLVDDLVLDDGKCTAKYIYEKV